MTSGLELMGVAAGVVGAWRMAHGDLPHHYFYCEDNPHGFHEPVFVRAYDNFSRVEIREVRVSDA